MRISRTSALSDRFLVADQELDGALREQASAVLLGQDLLGRPYREDGLDPARGLNCYGVVREIYRREGFALPNLRAGSAEIEEFRRLWEPAERAERMLDIIRTVSSGIEGVWVVVGCIEGKWVAMTSVERVGVCQRQVRIVMRSQEAQAYRLRRASIG